MIPLPTVVATAVVTNAPREVRDRRDQRRRAAARAPASRSLVATAFAVSWKPFVKSKSERDDDRDDEQRHRFLTRIASSTSAAFSQASTASSICSWMSFQRMIVSGSCSRRKSSAIASRDEPVALVLELAQRVAAARCESLKPSSSSTASCSRDAAR